MLNTKEMAADILEACADVFSLEDSFRTTRTLARNSGLYAVPPTDPKACSWCSMGAIDVATKDLIGEHSADARSEARALAIKRLDFYVKAPCWSIAGWNDDSKTTTESVVKTFKKAAASIRKELTENK